LNCAICSFILPHGDLAEKNCKQVLLKFFEKKLIEAMEEIKDLKQVIESFESETT